MDKEHLGSVVEMMRDEMIDAHAEMTVSTDHLRAVLDALEVALARAEGAGTPQIHRAGMRWMDVTPDERLPIRILEAYIDSGFFTDNTSGANPKNPLCIAMNEAQEDRNKILRKAICRLSPTEHIAKLEARNAELEAQAAAQAGGAVPGLAEDAYPRQREHVAFLGALRFELENPTPSEAPTSFDINRDYFDHYANVFSKDNERMAHGVGFMNGAAWHRRQFPVSRVLGEGCEWIEQSDCEDEREYRTSCGAAWMTNSGTPDDNDMRFCPMCGKRIALRAAKGEET